METARRNPVTTPAPDDDSSAAVTECTAKQEIFARAWAETGNQSAAYRRAYNVHERTTANVVWASASRLAALPHVRKRYEELRQQAALETVMTVREAFQHLVDIATADPNEIAYVAKRCCRHCYGDGHNYQWADDAEYMNACVAALDAKKEPPSAAGGFGYTRALEPVLTCPHCLGNGIEEVVVNDTTKLEGKARKLLKGLDYKNGQWVVQMHDQQKAMEMALRMLGAFNDKLDIRTPNERKASNRMPDNIESEQEAARAYIAFMGGAA